MNITEKKFVDLIEIINFINIQVREVTIIEKDGTELVRNYNRFVLNPGDDLTGKNEKIIAIANLLWTQEVINDYKSKLINTLMSNKVS